jgi:hypothetical protein
VGAQSCAPDNTTCTAWTNHTAEQKGVADKKNQPLEFQLGACPAMLCYAVPSAARSQRRRGLAHISVLHLCAAEPELA